jgi:threonine-phosphate decarboxylase
MAFPLFPSSLTSFPIWNNFSNMEAQHGGDIYATPDLVERIKSGTFTDFSVNTNPLGMPAPVAEALREQAADFARYPDPRCRQLRSALGEWKALDHERIVCGNGSADILFRLCHSRKPRQVLIAVPAFSEYERAAREAGASINYHYLREDEGFTLGPRFIEDIQPEIDMVFLANPNNPTGKTIGEDLVRQILSRCAATGALLVMDECFLPFTDAASATGLLNTAPASLVVVKALTKTFCLAGLRVGYGISADKGIIAALRDSGQHWSVSAPAQAAGLAALRCGDWFAESKKMIPGARAELADSLRALGLTVYDSAANFLLFRLEKPLAPLLERRCFDRGFLIRPCGNFRGLDDRYYRVAVRTPEENRALVYVLRGALAEVQFHA